MKDDHSPASPDRRPVNPQELLNWFLEQNLFGSGATLGDVARYFDRSLDHVKRLSAKSRLIPNQTNVFFDASRFASSVVNARCPRGVVILVGRLGLEPRTKAL